MKTSPRIHSGPAGSGMSIPMMARMQTLLLPALMMYSSPSSVYSWPAVDGRSGVARREKSTNSSARRQTQGAKLNWKTPSSSAQRPEKRPLCRCRIVQKRAPYSTASSAGTSTLIEISTSVYRPEVQKRPTSAYNTPTGYHSTGWAHNLGVRDPSGSFSPPASTYTCTFSSRNPWSDPPPIPVPRPLKALPLSCLLPIQGW